MCALLERALYVDRLLLLPIFCGSVLGGHVQPLLPTVFAVGNTRQSDLACVVGSAHFSYNIGTHVVIYANFAHKGIFAQKAFS
jgi:hypothetical protein